MLKAILKIIAKNPPSIAIAFAGLLSLAGKLNEAVMFLIVGVFLQGLWMYLRYSR